MILYIAEKPSLGRAIAEALTLSKKQPLRKGDGCIYIGDGHCVSWCIGHLLEQVEPDAYDPSFKQWKFEHLPIIPSQWQLQAKPKTRKQLGILRKLVKQADQLIHAGDPDREGQLLVDQIIQYFKVSKVKRDNILRLLVSDLNSKAVIEALNKLQSNKNFMSLSISALARSRADWLYGINMTRAYTLQGRKVSYRGVLSVGRVQTPLLGMVVRRDLEREGFSSKPFFQVIADIKIPSGECFKAKWLPSEACQPYMDDSGRVLSKALACNVIERIKHQPARVKKSQQKDKQQSPPLPYNLSSLQIDAAKRFGMSAKQVLECCQSLYEKHKLLTYPRSDCRYLPSQHHHQATAVLQSIAQNSESIKSELLKNACQTATPTIKSKAWNDTKVSAHHAIIPTEKRLDLNKLSRSECNIYQQVARQYIAQFYANSQVRKSEIHLSIVGGDFIAKAKELVSLGWRILYDLNPDAITNTRRGAKSDGSNKANHGTNHEMKSAFNQTLPKVAKNDSVLCRAGELLEKQTSPPKSFDDASLLAAMTGISRYLNDPELRKILKDTDGLGTEATRAGIIELLFKRQFLRREHKHIYATETGRALIGSLPDSATHPDMTARWEMQLEAISQRRDSYDNFMQPMIQTLTGLISDSENHLPAGLKNSPRSKSTKSFVKRSSVKKSQPKMNKKDFARSLP